MPADALDYQLDVPVISSSGKTITNALSQGEINDLVTQLTHNKKKLKIRASKNRMIPTYEKGY